MYRSSLTKRVRFYCAVIHYDSVLSKCALQQIELVAVQGLTRKADGAPKAIWKAKLES